MSIEKVRAFMKERGYAHRIQEFSVSSATVELAAQAVGCEPQRIAKTLSFMLSDGPVLILAAGDAKIDNSKISIVIATITFIPLPPSIFHQAVNIK